MQNKENAPGGNGRGDEGLATRMSHNQDTTSIPQRQDLAGFFGGQWVAVPRILWRVIWQKGLTMLELRILAVLIDQSWHAGYRVDTMSQITPGDLETLIGGPRSRIRAALRAMESCNVIQRADGGRYSVNKDPWAWTGDYALDRAAFDTAMNHLKRMKERKYQADALAHVCASRAQHVMQTTQTTSPKGPVAGNIGSMPEACPEHAQLANHEVGTDRPQEELKVGTDCPQQMGTDHPQEVGTDRPHLDAANPCGDGDGGAPLEGSLDPKRKKKSNLDPPAAAAHSLSAPSATDDAHRTYTPGVIVERINTARSFKGMPPLTDEETQAELPGIKRFCERFTDDEIRRGLGEWMAGDQPATVPALIAFLVARQHPKVSRAERLVS